jgi:hypothetical protein
MKRRRISGLLAILCGLTAPVYAGHPCAHILICCRDENQGVTFEVNGQFIGDHDYGDLEQVRDILQKLKDAGIRSVIVDMTNPSQWTRFRDAYEPMVDHVAQVCREKEMQYFLHIGGGLTPEIKQRNNITQEHIPFWNDIANYIWEKWAQTPEYRTYGFGDERPILLIFRPGHLFMPDLKTAAGEDKNFLEKFRTGTMQINEVIDHPMECDGWGYRNRWQNQSGSVRYTSPNGGVHPSTWHKISTAEWEKQVRWVKQAGEYSVYGSYDDSCDCIFWGIADTSGSRKPCNVYPAPENPRCYYDILQKVLTK